MIVSGKSPYDGTHYFRAWKEGAIYNGETYETYDVDNYDTYAIAATGAGLGIYIAELPDDADLAELVYQLSDGPIAGNDVTWIIERGIGPPIIAESNSVSGEDSTLVDPVDPQEGQVIEVENEIF